MTEVSGNEVVVDIDVLVPVAPTIGLKSKVGRNLIFTISLPTVAEDGGPVEPFAVELFWSQESMAGKTAEELKAANTAVATAAPFTGEIDIAVSVPKYGTRYFFLPFTTTGT